MSDRIARRAQARCPYVFPDGVCGAVLELGADRGDVLTFWCHDHPTPRRYTVPIERFRTTPSPHRRKRARRPW